jgi:hypothetical protein
VGRRAWGRGGDGQGNGRESSSRGPQEDSPLVREIVSRARGWSDRLTGVSSHGEVPSTSATACIRHGLQSCLLIG